MRYIVQCLLPSPVTGKLYQPCGDRSTIFIDGRLKRENAHAIAAAECIKRGFTHYRMGFGDRLECGDRARLIEAAPQE